MALHQFDPVADSLFRAALAEGRTGELLVCLWAGGSASIDAGGHLVTGVGTEVLTEIPADDRDGGGEGPAFCTCSSALVERIPLFQSAQCGRCRRAIRPTPVEADPTPALGTERPVIRWTE